MSFPPCTPVTDGDEGAFTRRARSLELGFRTAETGSVVPVPAESLTIAGDLNVVDIQALVQYRISDLDAFVSNLADPQGCPNRATLRDAALAALSEVVGERSIGDLLDDDKSPVEDAITGKLQQMLDRYRSGMRIISIRLEQVMPPEPVREAFLVVDRASEDVQVNMDQAKAYETEMTARARSEAMGILQEAEAAKSLRVKQAPGEAERFAYILGEYEQEQNAAFRDAHVGSLEDILTGIGGFITAAGSSSRMAPLAGMTKGHTQFPATVRRVSLSQPDGFGSLVPHPLNPDIHVDGRLLRIDLPPATLLDVNKQSLVVEVYVRYRVADRAQFVRSLGTEARAKARLSSIIMTVLGAQITAATWQEVLGSRVDAEGVLVGTDFREQMRQRALLEVFREVEWADPPLGLTVSEVKIKHLSFPAEERAAIYERMRADAELIARRLRADGEAEAASIRASADREQAAILAETTQQADAIEAEGDAFAIDMIIEAVGQVPELSHYVDSLEAYKRSKGLTS